MYITLPSTTNQQLTELNPTPEGLSLTLTTREMNIEGGA
jgi:hypothetical protein